MDGVIASREARVVAFGQARAGPDPLPIHEIETGFEDFGSLLSGS